MSLEPCTLKRHEEGDSLAFQAKLTGAGANDMCNMQELTKDSILNLLKDRKPRLSSPKGPRYYPAHTLPYLRARAVFTTRTHLYTAASLSPSRAFTGFKKEIVYTYVGDIVVSVNPFKNVGAVGKAIRNRCAPPPPPPTLAHTHSLSRLLHCVVPLLFSPDAPPFLPARVVCRIITHTTNHKTQIQEGRRAEHAVTYAPCLPVSRSDLPPDDD